MIQKSKLHALLTFLFSVVFAHSLSAQHTSKQDIIKHTIATHNYYFRLRELGEYKAAYGMFTDRQKENVSLIAFSNTWETTKQRFGKLTHFENTNISWYKNPEGAPPGLYAAIDFRASFEKLPVYCGYLVWSIDEGYKLQREEMKFLENKTSKPMSAEEIEDAYQKLSCR